MRFSSTLLIIGGTTASGKSALALTLAARLAVSGIRTEIVNCDSVQLYRHLPILTERPDAAEEARAPHHLYGLFEPHEPVDAARWLAMAAPVIADIRGRGAVPVLVGGTGLYIHALFNGLAPVPAIDPGIRDVVRAMPAGDLHAVLLREDPVMAARLDPGDSQRLMRAIEVIRSTGRSLGQWQSEERWSPVKLEEVRGAVLLPPRERLRERIEERMRRMLANGAASEVEALCGIVRDPLSLPIGKTHGLAEMMAYLDGRMSEDEVVERTSIRVRQYAKRQSTWFRRQSPLLPVLAGFGEVPETVDKLLMHLDKMASREAD